jgi:hypothetical protein
MTGTACSSVDPTHRFRRFEAMSMSHGVAVARSSRDRSVRSVRSQSASRGPAGPFPGRQLGEIGEADRRRAERSRPARRRVAHVVIVDVRRGMRIDTSSSPVTSHRLSRQRHTSDITDASSGMKATSAPPACGRPGPRARPASRSPLLCLLAPDRKSGSPSPAITNRSAQRSRIRAHRSGTMDAVRR